MIYREARRWRTAGSNHLVLPSIIALHARFHYRRLRRDGASADTARSAVYDLLLVPTWTWTDPTRFVAGRRPAA